MTRHIKNYFFILLGAALYALTFNGFFAANSVAFGGVTGLAQLVNAFVPALPVGTLVFLFNVPLFLLGWTFLGGHLRVSSLIAMSLSSAFIDLFGRLITFPPMADRLLACLCGGALLGASIGLIFLQGATTGGTEIVARLLKLKLAWLPMGTLLMMADLVVIAAVALAFRKVDAALYGVVALFVSTRVMDRVLYGLDNAKVAYIISDHPQEIARVILEELSRGVTYLQGEGGYTGEKKRVILCTFKQRQIVAVKEAVRRADPNAFMIVTAAHEVLGEGFQSYQESL